MSTMKTSETELRHAVIDRLIAASMANSTPAREATLERWRSLAADQPSIPQPSKNYTGL